MLKINANIRAVDLGAKLEALVECAKTKTRRLHQRWHEADGSPVFTAAGRYTAQGWTEWTEGFFIGNAILLFDLSQDEEFLELGRKKCVAKMSSHLTHTGVHDHGFNNVSTYGNLLRLMNEGQIPEDAWERQFYELALKVSGAVQAARWTDLGPDEGFVHSFNGPHSLFADTIRSMRALSLSHSLGHCLMGEQDAPFSLLLRLVQHAEATTKYNVYFGSGRDRYDSIPGRVAHESVFNLKSGAYRCPNSQQGFSPFSTWTRGHAWILCGYAEQLEWLSTLKDSEFNQIGRKKDLVLAEFLRTARATADFYLAQMPADGIPYWDTGAPQLHKLGDYLEQNADPYNQFEPVDSSAAAIAAQGLLRLGRYLGSAAEGRLYFQAGLSVAARLLEAPYLSDDTEHEGILLHAIYHYPNAWDYVPPGSAVPYGESCMWGDYHLLELALYIQRQGQGQGQGRDYSFGWKELR